jgi:excisionase family DNA binding protein
MRTRRIADTEGIMNNQVLIAQMPARHQSEWLTAPEAAQYLRIAHRTLVRWARCGQIPAHRLSGMARVTWRFRRAELDAMLCPSSVGPVEREATA